MREIKFRQFIGGKFTYWGIGLDECTFIAPSSLGRENAANTPSDQFTGLKDKNGVEIYEGDLLYHPRQGVRMVIYPMSGNFAGFGLVNNNGMKNTLQDSHALYEVIGNIHQNPELLEK